MKYITIVPATHLLPKDYFHTNKMFWEQHPWPANISETQKSN